MRTEDQRNIPAVVSVSGMARLLDISRSRLYQLIKQGVFIPPVYSTENGRPLYRTEMIITNLGDKKSGIGANGKEVIFYASKNNSYPSSSDNTRRAGNRPDNDRQYHSLKGGLSSLGQKNISDAQIELALSVCFPEGTDNIDQGEILRAIYLFLKHRKST